MNRFSYLRASDVGEVVSALKDAPAAKIIAGGTNLVDLMKYNVERPERLIDITHVEALQEIIEGENGSLRIGALVSNSALAYDARVTERFPLLSSALLAGATPQLRNAATVGGNINQRTRCYYFYDAGTPCNKREPGTGCPAKTGLNRIHAILGQSEACIATHPSDMCVAMAALEAVVHVTGPDGERDIPFADYHRLPGDTPQKDNTLLDGEVVTGITLPASSTQFSANYTYLKLRDRLSYAFALVSVAVALEKEGDTVKRARIALGGVAHKPWRRAEAEALFEGKAADSGLFARVADALIDGARGYEHNAFKIRMAREAIIRALEQASAGTPQSNIDKHIV
ncbi:xanthine dehydrogenase family protein subunit M [Mesorhizobium sp. RP14(2022)]|uniref:Xanthine dehydrogenase family protein subunit M n=1 Tax=Mesorhizobium liriopis TaxID=2953882 RepID=A0ABT1C730_9HYPH|nr:xanthine dehydrogenase family protein subunit M [Mesorhizobium liriopis]MCO6050644.1 xanthine dehydrogenase family protein subunit M [Mesorhizobium liriopis]